MVEPDIQPQVALGRSGVNSNSINAGSDRRFWLTPRPFDLVSSLLYLSVLLEFVYSNTQSVLRCGCPFPWPAALGLGGLVLALLALDRVEYYFYGRKTPPRPAGWLLVSRLSLIILVVCLSGYGVGVFLYLIIPFLASLYFGTRASYWLGALVWLIFFAGLSLHNLNWYSEVRQVNDLIVFTIALIFIVAMAKVVVQEQTIRSRAEGLLEELEISNQKIAELATAQERNRLARDIHDTLGHYLSVINIQLEKSLAFREKRPEEADASVRHAKRLASEALQDVRHSVGSLRTTHEVFSLSTALTRLVSDTGNDTFKVELELEGSEREAEYSKPSLMALYRSAQEGLTNIQKHARASHARLKLNLAGEQATLRLSDNGQGFETGLLDKPSLLAQGDGGGYGLIGLQERLELVEGSLQIESRPGEGTTLVVSVPRTLLAQQRRNDRRLPAGK